MNIFQMLEQSGLLTMLGMGMVVGFLVIMVICISIMGKIIQALTSNKAAAGDSSVQPPSAVPASARQTAVTAAITAAVNEYRKTNP